MSNMKNKLTQSFYQKSDTPNLCKELLGKLLCTCIKGEITGGYITEVEAYLGAEDKACHAYNHRRTKRTEVMFHKGGICYVYLCYGMHYLLNVVTNQEDIPHAILIRSIHPTIGLDIMKKRRGEKSPLTQGPGNVTKALGIDSQFNGLSLNSDTIWIEERIHEPKKIISTPRVGVDYAGSDALLPLRFLLEK